MMESVSGRCADLCLAEQQHRHMGGSAFLLGLWFVSGPGEPRQPSAHLKAKLGQGLSFGNTQFATSKESTVQDEHNSIKL